MPLSFVQAKNGIATASTPSGIAELELAPIEDPEPLAAALRAAGATVADAFGELPSAVVSVLRAKASRSLMSEAERKAVWTTANSGPPIAEAELEVIFGRMAEAGA